MKPMVLFDNFDKKLISILSKFGHVKHLISYPIGGQYYWRNIENRWRFIIWRQFQTSAMLISIAYLYSTVSGNFLFLELFIMLMVVALLFIFTIFRFIVNFSEKESKGESSEMTKFHIHYFIWSTIFAGWMFFSLPFMDFDDSNKFNSSYELSFIQQWIFTA